MLLLSFNLDHYAAQIHKSPGLISRRLIIMQLLDGRHKNERRVFLGMIS